MTVTRTNLGKLRKNGLWAPISMRSVLQSQILESTDSLYFCVPHSKKIVIAEVKIKCKKLIEKAENNVKFWKLNGINELLVRTFT